MIYTLRVVISVSLGEVTATLVRNEILLPTGNVRSVERVSGVAVEVLQAGGLDQTHSVNLLAARDPYISAAHQSQSVNTKDVSHADRPQRMNATGTIISGVSSPVIGIQPYDL